MVTAPLFPIPIALVSYSLHLPTPIVSSFPSIPLPSFREGLGVCLFLREAGLVKFTPGSGKNYCRLL